jgi:hypothetical protein
MLRLFALFDGKREIVYSLTGLFILSYTVSFVFGAVTLFQLRGTSLMRSLCQTLDLLPFSVPRVSPPGSRLFGWIQQSCMGWHILRRPSLRTPHPDDDCA